MARQSRQGTLPTFLLTRPAPQSARFADQLRAVFGGQIRLAVSPLMVPRLLSPAIPDIPFRGVIFTSETGVAAYRRIAAEPLLPAWCVGDRTADAARQSGFAAQAAGGDSAGLSASLIAAGVSGPLVHACGRETAGNLAEVLNSAGIETVELVVYAQEPQTLLPEAVSLFLAAEPVLAPVFSPRSGRLLATEASVQNRRVPLWIVALSPAVGASVAAAKPERLIVADRPDVSGIMTGIAELTKAEAPS